MSSVAADAAGPYEERSLFVRKATGLVRGWSVRDAFIYAAFSINLVTLGLYIFSFGPFIPKGSLLWAVLLAGAYLVLQAVTYASLVAAMPRAGGGRRLRPGVDTWACSTWRWAASSTARRPHKANCMCTIDYDAQRRRRPYPMGHRARRRG